MGDVVMLVAITGLPVVAGHWARAHLGRRGRLAVLAALLFLSAGVGVWGYLGASADVPASQAVDAGLLAGIGMALLPLGVFYAIGYLLRSPPAAAVVWLLLAIPAAPYYAIVMIFGLAAQQDCPPGAYECPL